MCVTFFKDCQSFAFFNLYQTSFNDVLARIVERIFYEIQRCDLTFGLKRTRDISKNNVEEEEGKDGGENTGFRMETREEERGLTGFVKVKSEHTL